MLPLISAVELLEWGGSPFHQQWWLGYANTRSLTSLLIVGVYLFWPEEPCGIYSRGKFLARGQARARLHGQNTQTDLAFFSTFFRILWPLNCPHKRTGCGIRGLSRTGEWKSDLWTLSPQTFPPDSVPVVGLITRWGSRVAGRHGCVAEGKSGISPLFPSTHAHKDTHIPTSL